MTFAIEKAVKKLRVYGDRRFSPALKGVALSDPEPFVKIPIRYERAFGGTDKSQPDRKRHRVIRSNPVGRGCAYDVNSLLGQPAPAAMEGCDLLRPGKRHG